MSKLTDVDSHLITDSIPRKLTNLPDQKFFIEIGPDLEKKYCISKVEKINMKAFSDFFIRFVNQDMERVESVVRANDDKDFYKGHQVVHYKCGKTERIHGFYSGTMFKVLRFDPNHDVHSGKKHKRKK